jgi:hypothetical protein
MCAHRATPLGYWELEARKLALAGCSAIALQPMITFDPHHRLAGKNE